MQQYLATKLVQGEIGRGGPIAWQVRSPGLTPSHFLMGSMGEIMSFLSRYYISHMNEMTEQAIANVSTDTLEVWKI